MPVLLLSEQDVRQLLTMEAAIDSVEQVLRRMALDEAENIPRARCRTDHCMLHVMSGSSKKLGYLGYKSYATTKSGAAFHIGLYDGKSGELLSLIQADYLGQVRTGAASGVATKYMAREESDEVGVYGSGKQARTQVQAICKVRNIRRVQVFSPNEEHRNQFAREMSGICGSIVEPVARPQLAAANKDIVITATTSREPVLYGDWLAEGTHLNIIGSNFLAKSEIDTTTLRRSDNIVVDSKVQARLEAGDFHQALEEGSLHWAEIRELGQIVVGRFSGRERAQDITMFKSLGIALEDVAVAAHVYEAAREQGVGKVIDYWDEE